MAQVKLLIDAGHHGRVGCPVTVELDKAQVGDTAKACLVLGDATVPVQCEDRGARVAVRFLLGNLKRGQQQGATLLTGADTAGTTASGSVVELKDNAGERVDVIMSDGLFTSYQYNTTKYVRPFLYPLIGPHGLHLTRELEGDPKKGFDHIHHRSLYTAWGEVNHSDNWSEGRNHGWVRHRKFTRLASGGIYAEIIAENEWQDKESKPLMQQTTHLKIYNLARDRRIIDYQVIFHMTEGDVKFGDTKEGGILSLRVFPTMNARAGGRMQNAYGGVNEGECWGKRAQWIDYAGPNEGKWAGVAMMDHPSNFRYPTYWHARDYGLCTANPFGLSDFLGKGHDGSHTVKKGEDLTFTYRVFIHPGDAVEGNVAERYHDFINPPRVKVE